MIYVVKTITVTRDPEDNQEVWHAHSDAFFLDSINAFKTIEENWGDLCEAGYNRYAAVLAVEEGLYPIADELAWYEWNKSLDCYKRCERPKFLEYIGLSI